jgi:hypothetical protein
MSHDRLSRRDLFRGTGALAASLGASSALRLAVGGAAAATAATASIHIARAGSFSLVNPRVAHPVFAQSGGTFFIEIIADSWLDKGGWSVQLRNNLGASWSVPVVDAQYTTIDYDRANGWRLVVQPSSSMSPECYSLTVSHRSVESKASAERAVSLVPNLEADWYGLQLTDEHVMYDSHKHYANDDPKSGYRSADLVRWATPVINLINPRVVFNTGDQAHQYATTGYRYSYNDDIYRCYLNAKAGYRVPSLMMLGNHEIDEEDEEQRRRDWSRWESVAGRRFYHVRIGSLWAFAHDYFDPASRDFIDKLYRQSFGEGRVAGRVFLQHHTSEKGYRPGGDYAPTLMLIGHFHNQDVVDEYPYPILMGIAAHEYARASVVRFEKRDGRWRSNAADRWESSDNSLVGDYGSPKVSASFTNPNDGRARSNQVTVTNKINQRWDDGRVQFVMADGSYSVKGGDVLASYRQPDGKRVVLVRVDIPANGSLRLEVAEKGTSSFPAAAGETAPVEVLPPDEMAEPQGQLDAQGELVLPAGPADRTDGERAPIDPGDADHGLFQLRLPLLRAEL